MNLIKPASFEEFEQLAREGSIVAVERSVPADLLTPLAAYIRLSRGSAHSFLLESVEGGEHLARYSFLGADPLMIVRSKGLETELASPDGVKKLVGQTAVDYLREHFAGRSLARPELYSPMAGGVVGYLGYGAANWFDPAIQALPSEDYDAQFMIFRTVLAFDHARQQLKIAAIAHIEEGSDEARLRELYSEAIARTERVVTALRDAVELRDPVSRTASDEEFASNFAPQDFEQVVADAKELIAAGECFQVVPSQRFTRKTEAGPVEIYRALRMTNPSPYMFLLRCGEESLIGASPEMLVRVTGRKLEYRPIAGTRPRGATITEDKQLADEMLVDEKERAEHVMLVDLGRNDLGRVAEFGSVKPVRLMKVEKYSHVQHMVTELEATLRKDLDRFDALGACFPAGTVTGAPKIRAMQAIAELEKTPRGVYSGSVIYADYAGNLDSCIAIRTVELRRGEAKVQAGAGVVADSVPANELQETINKARGMANAVKLAEGGF